MNWLDLAIIIFLLVSLVRGLEVGFVRQFFSTTGFIGGLILGAWLQSYVIHLFTTPATKALLVLVMVLGFALLLMVAGEYAGLRLKLKLRETPLVNKFDRAFGSVVAVTTVLAAVWLGAAIFRNAPSEGWQQQVRNSRIVAALNSALPSAPDVISNLGHLINPNTFPQVFTGLEPRLEADTPLPELGELRTAVEDARPSVVKLQGQGCGGIVEGSGFVAGDGLVATNAHVVAGVDDPHVIDRGGSRPGDVVWFDPELDLAIVRAENLSGEPLALRTQIAGDGTPAAVLGYPESSGFTAGPATILDSFTARGRDIYNQNITERQVYAVNANIRSGHSGGPLVNVRGEVVGLIFAQSTTYENVGYALTANQIASALNVTKGTGTVGTGRCAR